MSLDLSQLHENLLSHVPYSYEGKDLLIIDFVTIMGSIYYYDISETSSGDNNRSVDAIIPVYNRAHWEGLLEDIEYLVNWVSEDDFHITLTENKYINPTLNLSLVFPNKHDATLFSGGLDSLSGAFYNFSNSISSDYVGFINKGEEGNHQLKVRDYYKRFFSDDTSINLIEKLSIKKNTYIQSTRSLLYFALGIAKNHFNESKNLYLFENGILSLNPELNNRYTTKTTHPKTIYLYNKLLKNADINITIKHPFLFKTKGEIINNMNVDFLDVVQHTFTCGQGRNPIKSHKGQCGVCIPCLLRKISLAAYDNEVYDVVYEYPYETKFSDIRDDAYRKDFESNFHYFELYYRSIVNGLIHVEIDTRKRYYGEKINYKELNQKMFDKFVIEFERFTEKHDPN